MNTKLFAAKKIAVAGVMAGSTVTLFATGFRLPDQDAFATARGEAFVATADNPSAIYYNPAGISQLEGQNLRGGIYGIYLDPSYTPPGSSTTYHNQDKLAAVPQVFYTYSQDNSPVSAGVGLYSPYGLAVRWPQTTGFRTVGKRASLMYVTLNPVVSFKVSDTFSFGGGITIDYAKADLRQGLFWPAQANDGFRFVGDGWTVGYNLGALWKPHEKLSLGVSFRSGTDVNLEGSIRDHNNVAVGPFPTFNEHSPANANLSFPLNAIFGFSYRPTPDWNVEFNADYTGWEAVQGINIHHSKPSIILPGTIPFPLGWQSSWYYEFGATRYLDNGWHVSAGYIFNENSLPDAHYTPLVADEDRHFFSVGVGRKMKSFNFDVAYQFGYGPARTVSGSGFSAAGQSADGKYDFISHAILVSAGINF